MILVLLQFLIILQFYVSLITATSNVLLSNTNMYPGDIPLISTNGLWQFTFAANGAVITISSTYSGQIFWSSTFNVATKFFVNNCGLFAFNGNTQVFSRNGDCTCANSAYGLMIMDSGNLAIVDGAGNSVGGQCNGVVFDTGTSQDLCAAGRYSATGAIPCSACSAGYFDPNTYIYVRRYI